MRRARLRRGVSDGLDSGMMKESETNSLETLKTRNFAANAEGDFSQPARYLVHLSRQAVMCSTPVLISVRDAASSALAGFRPVIFQ